MQFLGTVTAADQWDAPARTMKFRPSCDGSYEKLCHDTKKPMFMLELNKNKTLNQALAESKLERFIGMSNYLCKF